jgi:hypothetical protein
MFINVRLTADEGLFIINVRLAADEGLFIINEIGAFINAVVGEFEVSILNGHQLSLMYRENTIYEQKAYEIFNDIQSAVLEHAV